MTGNVMFKYIKLAKIYTNQIFEGRRTMQQKLKGNRFNFNLVCFRGTCASVYHRSNSTILLIISPFWSLQDTIPSVSLLATGEERGEEEGGGRWLKIAPPSFEAASHLTAASQR